MKKKRFLRSFAATALTIALVLGSVQPFGLGELTAYARSAETITFNNVTYDAWTSTDSLPAEGNYYLYYDVHITDTYTVPTTGPVKLLLNGKGIFLNVDADQKESVIKVPTGASLTIDDQHEVQRWFEVASDGFWTYNEESDEGCMDCGFITGGTADLGAGIYVEKGATLVMNGGGVVGNEAAPGASGTALVGGAGIYVEGDDTNPGQLKIYKGRITGNKCYISSTNSVYGGGILNCGITEIYSAAIINYNNIRGNNEGKGWGGGIANMAGSTFKMFGGSINRNKTNRAGGGIYMETGCNETSIRDGSVEYNESKYGGGIYSKGDLILDKGSIRNNIASMLGSGIYAYAGTSIKMGYNEANKALIVKNNSNDNFYLANGAKIDVCGTLNSDTCIYISMESPSVFTNTSTEPDLTGYNVAEKFISDLDSYVVSKNSAGQLELHLPAPETSTPDPITFNNVTYNAWTRTDSLPAEEGAFYLTDDVTISNTWEIASQANVKLLLNGHGIIKSGAGRVIKVNQFAKLTIDDQMTETHYFGNNNGLGVLTTQQAGDYFLDGGYITGGSVSDCGAGIYIDKLAEVTINGGNVVGNLVSTNDSTNSAYVGGAGIYVAGDGYNFGTLKINGGYVAGNKCYSSGNDALTGRTFGGGILNFGDTTIGSDAHIVYNTAGGNRGYGGGIANRGSGILRMQGGHIDHNTADYAGGGIFSDSEGNSDKLFLSGGIIEYNTAQQGGGVEAEGNLVLNQCEVSNNIAALLGGGIFVGNGNQIKLGYNLLDKKVLIKNNKNNSLSPAVTDNLYLGTGALIDICSEINTDTSIGITMQAPGVFTNTTKNEALQIDRTGFNDATKFFSDHSNYIISKLESGQLTLDEKPAHQHTFTYSADGNKITADCDDCDYSISLTLKRPEKLYREGTESPAAVLEGLTDFNEATGLNISASDVNYYNPAVDPAYDSLITGGAPSMRGRYKAKITVEGVSASLNYLIGKTPYTGASTNAGDITFDTAVTDTLPTESGHYFLTGDIGIDDTWTIPKNKEIYLDFNGCVIYLLGNNGPKPVVNVLGQLKLYDEGESDQGGIANPTSENAVNVNGGDLYIYDGVILGTAIGVNVTNSGTLHLIGGGIFENKYGVSASPDSAVIFEANALTLFYSEAADILLKCDADNEALIYISGELKYDRPVKVAIMNVAGTDPVAVEGLFAKGWNSAMSGKNCTLYFESASDEFDVALTSDGNNVKLVPAHQHTFTYSVRGNTITASCSGTDCNVNSFFQILSPELTYVGETGKSATVRFNHLDEFNTATGLNISASDVVYYDYFEYPDRISAEYTEKLTGAPTAAGIYTATITIGDVMAAVNYVICGIEGGTHEAMVVDGITFQPVSELPTESGHYYLTQDIKLNSSWVIGNDKEIDLCLNRHRITYDGNGSANPAVKLYGTLNLYDNGDDYHKGSITNLTQDCAIYICNGTLNMHGGEITGVKKYTAVVMSEESSFYMDGGFIDENKEGVSVGPLSYFGVKDGSYIYANWGPDVKLTENNLGHPYINILGPLTSACTMLVELVGLVPPDGFGPIEGRVTEGWTKYMDGKYFPTYFASYYELLPMNLANGELIIGTANEPSPSPSSPSPAAPSPIIQPSPIATPTNTPTPELLPKAYTVTAPVGKDLIYNGRSQQLADEGSASGGTLWYLLSMSDTEPILGWQSGVPSATEAGKYYIWYWVVGDDMHRDSDKSYVISTITDPKATATPTERPTATPTAIPTATPTLKPGVTATPTPVPTATPTKAPTATPTPTKAPEIPSFVVREPKGKTLAYTGAEQILALAGSAGGGTMQYALGTDGSTVPSGGWSEAVPGATATGTYFVWYRVVADAQHIDNEPAYVTSSISAMVTEAPAQGYYEEVKTKDGFIRDITGTEEAPEEENPLVANIINEEEELEELLNVQSDEKEKGVNVWLEVTDVTEIIPEEEKKAIEEATEDYTVAVYVDVSLFKKVGDETQSKVHETSDKMKISFKLPDEFVATGKDFAVVRYHDGVSEIILGEYDPVTHIFTFETDRFSSYAIIYAEEGKIVVKAPKTGDFLVLKNICMILTMLALIAFFVREYKKEEE